MGYDLLPRNKKIKEFHVGGLMWPIMMQETGAGYVVGYGKGRTPASCVYIPDKRGGGPHSNDGYYISSEEAKMMATIIRGFLSVQRFVNSEWDAMAKEEREKAIEVKSYNGQPLYRKPWHEDRLKQFEAFCDFAEKSQGFKIW